MTTTVCLTFDFDAIALWINDFKTTAPMPVSRGEFAPRVAIPRILALLERRGVPATFFIPGHTVDHFPEACRAIKAAGHEIAGHGYLHEAPLELADRAAENAVLERSERSFETVLGLRPQGYRAPSWDVSAHTIGLLAERGYAYDSSLMHDDFKPYRPRMGDKVGADGTFVPGKPAPIVEIPVAWELDDFPYFTFIPGTSSRGLAACEHVYAAWLAEFEYCHAHVDDGVFDLAMHPQVIGRGPRMAMLERLVDEMARRPGVTFSTMIDVAKAARV